MFRKTCTAILAALSATALLPGSPAAADPIYYTVHVGYNKKCLDADAWQDAVWHNGGKVQTWECNGSPQQKWRRDGLQIRVGTNGKCLDADFTHIWTNGTKVQVWDCNGSEQQQWNEVNGALHVGYNGKCLDADATNIWNNGTKVQLWDCNGSPQQQWIFQQ